MSEGDTNLIEMLRKEANDVKSCFTNFSFQAIALSGIVLGAVANFQPNKPFVGLAGILLVAVLLTVSRIGNYKYATAFRHFGFELFLANNQYLKNGNLVKNLDLEWEEAMRVWRVIQATVFDCIYYTKENTDRLNIRDRLNYNQVNKDLLKNKPDARSWWFEPRSIVETDLDRNRNILKWHPGSYLKTMQNTLHLIAYLSIVPLFIMTLQFQFDADYNNILLNGFQLFNIKFLGLISGFITIITLLYMIYKDREIRARRNLLENGLLSIHSCAIIWEVAFLAHKQAKTKMAKSKKTDQTTYMENLSSIADDIRKECSMITKWIEKNKPAIIVKSPVKRRRTTKANGDSKKIAKPLKP